MDERMDGQTDGRMDGWCKILVKVKCCMLFELTEK